MGIRKLLINDASAEPVWRNKVRDAVNAAIGDVEAANLGSGTTALRPGTTRIGAFYYDTTIDRPIWWNGTVWKNAAGATV